MAVVAPGCSTARIERDGRLLRGTEGAVVAEYVILLVLVALGAGAGTVALGVPLLRLHRYTQMILVAPFP